MSTIRLRMDLKEVYEARRAGIPEEIIGKMINGLELTEKEKEIVNEHGKVYVLAHTKERGKVKINPQLRNLPGGKRVMVRSSNNSGEQSLEEIIAEELGAEVVKEYDSPFGRGKVFELDDGSEVLVFESGEIAEREAIERVREDLEESPEMFTQSWLEDFIYISSIDRGMMASDEGSFAVEDRDDDEIMDMAESYNVETKEKDIDDIREDVSEAVAHEWERGLDDPIEFLVEEKGMYSKEDLLKQPFINIDVDKASEDAIRVDGVAHFLGTYDGEENYGKGDMVYYYLDKP